MKRYLGSIICACCVLAPTTAMASAVASDPGPPAKVASVGGDVAGAFASQLATAGAAYLVTKLQDGALGSTGVTIGNFLSDVGLGAPQADTKVLDELKVVNERLTTLQQDVGTANVKLDQLGATVSNGNYAILVAFANKLRSAVLTGDRKLREIAAAAPSARKALAEDFVAFYKRELQDKELEFENYLTGGGVPGADGILKLSARKARSAAQPFFTATMSAFPTDVWNDYSMVQAVWLEEQLNVMHFEHKTPEQMQAAITLTQGAIDREFRELPPQRVFPNTVIDTRTGVMWTWRIDPAACQAQSDTQTSLYDKVAALRALPTKQRPADYTAQLTSLSEQQRAANKAVVQCLYDHGADVAPGIWDTNLDYVTTIPTNGAPSGGSWARPTVDQVKALDAGASGAVPAWLNARGGFPSKITGEVWTSARSGNNATTVNQTSGAVNSRDINQKYFSLLQGPIADPNWFWVGN